MLKFIIFSLMLPLSVSHAKAVNFAEDQRSPYEILKELYDSASAPAKPTDFKTIEELRKDRLSGFRILSVDILRIGDDSLMVTPEIERHEVSSWHRNYLLKSKTRFIIQAGDPGREAEPGHGPLFPPQPAIPRTGDVCGENMTLWPIIDVELIMNPLRDNCTELSRTPSDKNPWELGYSQTPTDLIFSIGLKKDGKVEKRTTIYYRRSGDLIAMKFVVEKFVPAHRIIEGYNYGFKDRSY